jgi:hypothetical protein
MCLHDTQERELMSEPPILHLHNPCSGVREEATEVTSQRSLSSLRIAHFMHPHIIPQRHVAHTLRRDENELPPYALPCSLNHHFHTGRAIHVVHEDIELIQAADRRSHSLPNRQQQADRRERLLATGERLGLAPCIGNLGEVGLDFDIQGLAAVIHDDAATELALAEKVAKGDLGTSGDVLAEESPAPVALDKGSLQLLFKRS